MPVFIVLIYKDIFSEGVLRGGKSVKFSDRFFMENFTLDPKKQQFLKEGGKKMIAIAKGALRLRTAALEAKRKERQEVGG